MMAMDTDGMPYREPLTIAAMTAECKAINIEKGWRSADGGPGSNTFGDYIALAHSELSEALEAYRSWRLADATGGPDGPRENSKPEGVGSEFADVLIRLLDMADVFGIDLEAEYRRKVAYNRTRSFQHGGRTLADAKSAPATPAHVSRFTALWTAIPTDPRGWWTGDDADVFVNQWINLGLPRLSLGDGQGERYVFECQDMRRAAELIGMTDSIIGAGVDDDGFEIVRGEYSVCIVQAGKEETKNA